MKKVALVLSALGFALFLASGAIRAQNCRYVSNIIEPCNGGCSVVVNSCAFGYSGGCYMVFPGKQCPCDLNVYWGTAQNSSTCSSLARPSVRVAVRRVVGPPRSFFIYLPNCAGTFSVDEVLG
jgi:hypothetical protein